MEFGLKSERGAAEHRSEPAEAADHLVSDHVHVVSPADLHHLPEIVCGGTITPPAPITGSAMKAATVSGPSLRISVFELVRQPHGEVFFALARVREAVMVRTGRVQDPGDRQVEIEVIVAAVP